MTVDQLKELLYNITMTRQEAFTLGLTKYEGTYPCKRCGQYIRYTSNYSCASRECTSAKNAQQYQKDPRAAIEHRRQYRSPEDNRRWYRENTDKAKASVRNWRSRHPGYAAARFAEYKARLFRAIPKWADLEKIRAVYEEAAQLGMTVDHIYPLAGEEVCGLHVENNLRIISHRDNSSKGNRLITEVS